MSPAKRGAQALAAAALKSAIGAFTVAAGGLNLWAAALGFFFWGLAIWHKAKADDPLVPDFR